MEVDGRASWILAILLCQEVILCDTVAFRFQILATEMSDRDDLDTVTTFICAPKRVDARIDDTDDVARSPQF